MNVELATIIISLVIVAANGLGALVNDRRYLKFKDEFSDQFTSIRERLTRLETLVRNGNASSHHH